jgi:hypothetical protein
MVDEAKELGLPVSTALPKEVLELMRRYPQTAQRRPSIEFESILLLYGPPEGPGRSAPRDGE